MKIVYNPTTSRVLYETDVEDTELIEEVEAVADGGFAIEEGTNLNDYLYDPEENTLVYSPVVVSPPPDLPYRVIYDLATLRIVQIVPETTINIGYDGAKCALAGVQEIPHGRLRDMLYDAENMTVVISPRERPQRVIPEKDRIIALIRDRYSIDDELAILRQRDTKPTEFAAYNAFVEECKQTVKGGNGE